MSTDIASAQDANQLLFNLVRFEQQLPRFIEDVVQRLAEEEILNPIKTKMKQKNYSQKIIDGTTIENIIVDGSGFVQFDVISEYNTEEGFDVATAREEGTRDHTIRPRDPKGVLRFILGGFVVGWSKGHLVKGIKASHIVRDTVKSRFPIFQQKLTEEIIQFYNSRVSA